MEKFKIIEKNKYDPNNDLPKINCRKEKDDKDDDIVDKTRRNFEAASYKNNEVDLEGWSPVKNKRKNRSPNASNDDKRTRIFSPEKAGKMIFKQIQHRGIDTIDNTTDDEDESESELHIIRKIFFSIYPM